jgi:hypothetical protein
MSRAPLYHWKDTELGRRGLCLILQYAESKAGGASLLTAAPGDFGVCGEEMRQWVLDRLPELEAEHFAHTGQPLTGRKMMSRLYNMFEVQPDGSRVPSGEHPTRNDTLAQLWNVMSGAQSDLFPVPTN